jgi:hypothetical protein
MSSRWFNTVVVIMWLTTMGWLMTEKVLPLLSLGEPPSISKIVNAQQNTPIVGWQVLCGQRRLGWALTETKRQPSGLTEVRSRIHLDSLPLEEMAPGWFQPLSRLIDRRTDKLAMDVRSVFAIDRLGHLFRFDSTLRFDPWNEVIWVHGTVESGQAVVEVFTRGGPFQRVVVPLLSNTLLSDAFSPQWQTQLPGLREGQTWSVPIYNPLWPSNHPLEILRATVERPEPICWNGKMVSAWLVVYRSESGSGAGASQNPRGKLWVRRDGAVLQQQGMLFDSTITFVRLADEKATAVAATAGRQWWSLENDPRAEHHD